MTAVVYTQSNTEQIKLVAGFRHKKFINKPHFTVVLCSTVEYCVARLMTKNTILRKDLDCI